MAMPPLTLENIRPYLLDVIYEELKDEKLEELSCSEGVNVTFNQKTINVRIGWHFDAQTETIDGLFIRVYSEEMINAVVMKKDCFNQIIVLNENQHKSSTVWSQERSSELIQYFSMIRHAPRCHEPILFKAEGFVYAHKDISSFFENNQDMLPKSLRTAIFSPRPKNSAYWIGGVLGLLLIGYIAQKVFKRAKNSVYSG